MKKIVGILTVACICVFGIHSCSETPVGEGSPDLSPAPDSSWHSHVSAPTTGSVVGVEFVNELSGWVITSKDEVYHTEDGGNNWSPQSVVGDFDPVDIQFISENVGWIRSLQIRRYGGLDPIPCIPQSIHVTRDGGGIWKNVGAEVELFHISDMQLISENIGFIAGISCSGGAILKTIDGGDEWKTVSLTHGFDVMSITFIDERNGWAAMGNSPLLRGRYSFTTDSSSFILKTQDGGESWDRIYIFGDSISLQLIHFVNERKGWITSMIPVRSTFPEKPSPDDVRLQFTTEDGGESWQEIPDNSIWLNLSNMIDFQFSDEQVGWGLLRGDYDKGHGLAKTMDGGSSWERVTVDPNFLNRTIVRGMDFNSSTKGWVVADSRNGPRIFHTTNGGSWPQ